MVEPYDCNVAAFQRGKRVIVQVIECVGVIFFSDYDAGDGVNDDEHGIVLDCKCKQFPAASR